MPLGGFCVIRWNYAPGSSVRSCEPPIFPGAGRRSRRYQYMIVQWRGAAFERQQFVKGKTGMRAFITGITGQDGSYMAELLLAKGYEVYGLVRRSSLEKFDRLAGITDQIKFVEGDLTDQGSLDIALREIRPDEVYNLAAQSFVHVSWNQPVLTADVTGVGVVRILEAIRRHSPRSRFLQASSSEMF